MKWSIIGLFSIGFVAALSAAVLVAALQSRTSPAKPALITGEATAAEDAVTVVVAVRDLDALTVIAADDVASRSVAREIVPEGAATDPVQVVGKVLRVPLKSSTAFNRSHFVAEGSAIHLASALVPGKRAVSIALHDEMGIEPLLYPGSMVDVLSTMSLDAGGGVGEQPYSFTILQRVVVLAVGHETVVAPATQEQGGSPIAKGPRPMVTLLLSPEESEVLKLAMEQGSISLTLRNPMDTEPVAAAGTRLSQVAPMFGDAVERERKWSTVVLRGGVAETRTFDVAASEKQ